MIRKTKMKLKLLTDYTMPQFIEKGLKEGMTQYSG